MAVEITARWLGVGLSAAGERRELSLPDGAVVNDALEALQQSGAFQIGLDKLKLVRLLLNNSPCNKQTKLKNGDLLLILSLLAGG